MENLSVAELAGEDLVRVVDVASARAKRGVRRYFEREAVQEIDVPWITGVTGACENVSTLYRVIGKAPQYLTQTGQLALEVALRDHSAVWSAIHSCRADNPDARHLNEFQLVEEEYSCDFMGVSRQQYDPISMFEHLQERIRDAVQSALRSIIDSDVGVLVAPSVVAAAEMDRWAAISYIEAIELLNESKAGQQLKFGDDLNPASEQLLLSLVAAKNDSTLEPLFVTHFPQELKFFNMKVDPSNARVVLSTDLLLPNAGEAVGGAVREEEYGVLVRRLGQSAMLKQLEAHGAGAIDGFAGYLEIIEEERLPPHAGYGIGLERLLQFALSVRDISLVSTIQRLKVGLRDV